MPIDPSVLSDFLRKQQQPQDVEGLSSMFQQPAQGQQANPAEALQPTVADAAPMPSQTITKTPTVDNTPPSFSDTLLNGMFQPGAQQIPQFKDDTSPARSLLANMMYGMSASLTGQKFQSVRDRKYAEYMDRVKLQLEQQQRNQQLQIAQMNNVRQFLKDKNTQDFHSQLNQLRDTRNTDLRNYQQGQLQARLRMNDIQFQNFMSQDAYHKAMEAHLQNQDANAVNPVSKDPEYIRAMALVNSQYASQGIDPKDPSIYPKYLQAVNTQAEAFKAQQAAMKPNPADKPTPYFVPQGDGSFRRVDVGPGGTVPPGALQATGVNSLDTPTTATRTMVESAPKVLYFVNKQLNALNALESKFGPMAGRKAEFLTGKIGLPGNGVSQYRTNNGLLETSLMKMHVGARGGDTMMQHFHDVIGGMNQDPSNARESLEAIKDYANEVISQGKAAGMRIPDMPEASGSSSLPTISNQKDYDALPAGSQYIFNGAIKTKGK